MRKMRHADSMTQLCLKDAADPRQSFLYKLSSKPCFELFRHVLLVSSPQDHYVPRHSARVEFCAEALGDQTLGEHDTYDSTHLISSFSFAYSVLFKHQLLCQPFHIIIRKT